MKRCSKCGIEKPLEEFHRASSAKDGRYSHCKACVRLYTQSDAFKATQAKYRKSIKGREKSYAWKKTEVGKANHKRYRDGEAFKTYAKKSRRTEDAVQRRRAEEKLRYQRSEDFRKRVYAKVQRQAREAVAALKTRYIACLLRRQMFPTITPELIELKRAQLDMKRLARQLRKAIKDESSNNHA